MERIARELPAEAKNRQVKPSAAKEWLESEVVEVRIYRDALAAVFARVPHAWKKIVDVRSLEREGGGWLNSGNCVVGSLEEARAVFLETILFKEAVALRDSRKPVPEPAAHLRSFVNFLQQEGKEPKELLREAVAQPQMVIIGELHHRLIYWGLNASLAHDLSGVAPERPSARRKISSRACTGRGAVMDVLRDMLEMGWPDQAMLDFFVAVWKANQSLPCEKRLPIVLVDMARPWKEITDRKDWRKYDTDRDALMANNILRDRRAHKVVKRHALFITGATHALLGLQRPDGVWFKSAGWHLREELRFCLCSSDE